MTPILFSCSRSSSVESGESGFVEVCGNVDVLSSDRQILSVVHWNVDSNVVCLLWAPAIMIPAELLQYFKAYLPDILCVRIFRHHRAPDKYFAVFQLVSHSVAEIFVEEYNGALLSSLDESRCIFFPVKRICFFGEFGSNIQREFSFLHAEGQDAALLSNVPVSPPIDLTERPVAQGRGLSLSPSLLSDGPVPCDHELCVLCLERLSLKGLLTTYCSHTFHLDCIVHLDNPQCPVCRLDSGAIDVCWGVLIFCVCV